MADSNNKNISYNKQHKLINNQGEEVCIPKHWQFLPAGDAGLTRKVTKHNLYFRLVFQKGRRIQSKGIWAPKEIINRETAAIQQLRNTEQYQKQTQYNKQYREKKEKEYQQEFFLSIIQFLNFHVRYQNIERVLAKLICKHAIPVGSNTVARTKMIPIEERASKAVIAWMRHQTTAYDNMHIARIKGERRMVRRELAKYSVSILNNYRKGEDILPSCPLKQFFEKKIKEREFGNGNQELGD